jgi:hypothetical protein
MIGYQQGKITDKKVVAELEEVNKKFGIVAPKAVVDRARPEQSVLHPFFEWDDGVAGEAYRREQARSLIRCVYVEVKPKGATETILIPKYVSISTDRTNADGGYRSMQFVLSDKKLKEQMLEDALHELIRFREKYAKLKELAGVMNEIDKLPLIKKMKKGEE